MFVAADFDVTFLDYLMNRVGRQPPEGVLNKV